MPETPSLDAQRQFWNSWNSGYRYQDHLDPFMERQREKAVEVARELRLHGARILDVGCGTGWLADSLREFGNVAGIDLSPTAIEFGRRAFPGVRLYCGDLASGEIGAGYDLVVSADVIGWLRSPAGEQWSRIAHGGGAVHPAEQPQTQWRATGPLDAGADPAGAPPLTAAGAGWRP